MCCQSHSSRPFDQQLVENNNKANLHATGPFGAKPPVTGRFTSQRPWSCIISVLNYYGELTLSQPFQPWAAQQNCLPIGYKSWDSIIIQFVIQGPVMQKTLDDVIACTYVHVQYLTPMRPNKAQTVLTACDVDAATYSFCSQDSKFSPHPPSGSRWETNQSQVFCTSKHTDLQKICRSEK